MSHYSLRESRIVIRQQVYHIIEWGPKHGRPLLLLHGFLGTAQDFSPIVKRLRDDRRVIAIDFLGHGKSAAPEDAKRYRMQHMLRDIVAILSVKDISSTDILGYSMGGRVALAFTITHAKRVRSLILESASPGLVTAHLQDIRKKADEVLVQKMQEKGLPSFVDDWERNSLFESQQGLPSTVYAKQRKVRLSHTVKGLAGSLKGLGTGSQPSYWERLAQIDRPVLLVTGSLDTKFTAIAQEMARTLPKVVWHPVEGVGHNIHLENPKAFVSRILNFLDENGENRK